MMDLPSEIQELEFLPQTFLEVLLGFLRGEDNFPFMYIISKLDLKSYKSERELNELASVLSYLRLIWTDKKSFWSTIDEFFKIADFFLQIENPIKRQEILALFTVYPQYKHLVIRRTGKSDWYDLISVKRG